MMQELLTTFNDDNLSAVSLVPSSFPPDARFVVTHSDGNDAGTILWNREQEHSFPQVKDLKQRVRDKINPEKYLGHSDNQQRFSEGETTSSEEEQGIIGVAAPGETILSQVLSEVPSPNVAIRYCTGCRWMLRAAYFATELLTAFETEINSVTLVPSRPPEKGGIFVVSLNGGIIWDREKDGGFPETKDLKQKIRDVIGSSKDLGHSTHEKQDKEESPDIDDDEASKIRAYYGVQ